MSRRIWFGLVATLFLAASASAALNPEVLRGSAVVKVGGTTRVYLYVESDSNVAAPRESVREEVGANRTVAARPGRVDRFFVLAGHDPIDALTVLDLNAATVVVTPQRVIATSAADRKAVVLALDGVPADEQFPEGWKVLRFSGFGITQRWGDLSSLNMEKAHRLLLRSDCEEIDPYCVENLDPNGGGSNGTSCTAGGTGATACSCSAGGNSCQVSCGVGYHACCDCGFFGATCACYRN